MLTYKSNSNPNLFEISVGIEFDAVKIFFLFQLVFPCYESDLFCFNTHTTIKELVPFATRKYLKFPDIYTKKRVIATTGKQGLISSRTLFHCIPIKFICINFVQQRYSNFTTFHNIHGIPRVTTYKTKSY